MKKHFDYVTDDRGNAIEGATVAVQQSGVNSVIYSDNALTLAANPITTASDGYFEFYAPDGIYDFVVTYNGVSQTITDVQVFDGAGQEGINDRALTVPLPEAGVEIPGIATRSSKFFGFDALGNPEAIALNAASGADLIGSDDSFSGSLWTTVSGFIAKFTDAAQKGLRILSSSVSHSDGTDTLTGSLRYFIGNSTPSTDDSALLIGRGLAGSYFSGAHAVRDETTYSPSGTGLFAYASFDSIAKINGSENINHLRSFQARPEYGGSGTIDEVSGFTSQITHSGVGIITDAYSLRIDHSLVPSGGFITTHYGILIDDLTQSGAVGAAYGLYSQSVNVSSYHAGAFQFGTAPKISASGFTTYGAILSHDASGNLITNPNFNVVNGTLTMANATTSKIVSSTAFSLQLDAVGTTESLKPHKLPVYTVATLPSPASAYSYSKCFVSDANATTFAAIVAGGGSNKVPVYSDGTNWLIG